MSGTNQIYQLDVEKQLGEEYWTNVYYMRNTSSSTLLQDVADLVQRERGFHGTVVNYTKVRARPLNSLGDTGIIFPQNATGIRNQGSYLPLFNVLRMDMAVDIGRPSRKYFRLPVGEGDQADGVFTPENVTYFTEVANNFITDLAGRLCDVDGQLIINAVVQRKVGMRQLRRGSKRRVIP